MREQHLRIVEVDEVEADRARVERETPERERQRGDQGRVPRHRDADPDRLNLAAGFAAPRGAHRPSLQANPIDRDVPRRP